MKIQLKADGKKSQIVIVDGVEKGKVIKLPNGRFTAFAFGAGMVGNKATSEEAVKAVAQAKPKAAKPDKTEKRAARKAARKLAKKAVKSGKRKAAKKAAEKTKAAKPAKKSAAVAKVKAARAERRALRKALKAIPEKVWDRIDANLAVLAQKFNDDLGKVTRSNFPDGFMHKGKWIVAPNFSPDHKSEVDPAKTYGKAYAAWVESRNAEQRARSALTFLKRDDNRVAA